MKILKLYILLLAGSLIFGVGKAFEKKIADFELDEVKLVDKVQVEEKTTNPIVEEQKETEDEKNEEKNIPKVIKTQKKEIKSAQTTTTRKVQNTMPSTTQKITTTTSVKYVHKSEESDSSKPPTTKKVQIWEALGMSEEDYKYKPAFAGDRVDFKNYEECFNYGYAYEPYLNGEETFNCREVISLSGNFLGIMFKTEKNIKDKS